MPHCRHFGACGGCHYQHADYETQLKFKQAILRETLQRGGVSAAGNNRGSGRRSMAVSQSHSPCVGRGRTRWISRAALARSGSHCRVPDCGAAAGEGCAAIRGGLEGAEAGVSRDRRFRSFQMPKKRRCWRALLCLIRATRGFDRVFEEWKRHMPALAGAEMVEDAGRRPHASTALAQSGEAH